MQSSEKENDWQKKRGYQAYGACLGGLELYELNLISSVSKKLRKYF